MSFVLGEHIIKTSACNVVRTYLKLYPYFNRVTIDNESVSQTVQYIYKEAIFLTKSPSM
jgi:hypothetical protein